MNGEKVFVELIVKTSEPQIQPALGQSGLEAILKSLLSQPIGAREAKPHAGTGE